MTLAVELIAVGTELLLGQLVDTNTAHIASELAAGGIDVYGTHQVGDNQSRISRAVRDALSRVDGVITTGGLGPTVDDLTKEAVAEALDLDLRLHEPSLQQMKDFFAMIGREMRENNCKQAYVPRGSFVLENPRGTAPGFVAFNQAGRFVACMPGVPREMKPMLADILIPYLRERYKLSEAIHTRVLHTINIGESELDHRIADIFRSGENPKIAVLAHEQMCDVKIMAKTDSAEKAHALIAPVEAQIRERLEGHVFGADGDTLESAVQELLHAESKTISVAESCTGGRIASALTATPGSSKNFVGGIIAYDNAVKIGDLSVSESTLAEHGAVSEATVRAMATGARRRYGTSYALATTGIAGPDGGTEEKPVGLVWYAIDNGESVKARSVRFRGDRAAIQRRATIYALGLLWHTLKFGEKLERR